MEICFYGQIYSRKAVCLLAFCCQHKHSVEHRGSLVKKVGRSVCACQWGRESTFVSVVSRQFWERGDRTSSLSTPKLCPYLTEKKKKKRAWTWFTHPALGRTNEPSGWLWCVFLATCGSPHPECQRCRSVGSVGDSQGGSRAPRSTSAAARWPQRKEPDSWRMSPPATQLAEKREAAAVSGLGGSRVSSW